MDVRFTDWVVAGVGLGTGLALVGGVLFALVALVFGVRINDTELRARSVAAPAVADTPSLDQITIMQTRVPARSHTECYAETGGKINSAYRRCREGFYETQGVRVQDDGAATVP